MNTRNNAPEFAPAKTALLGIDNELIHAVRNKLEPVLLSKSSQIYDHADKADDMPDSILAEHEKVLHFYDYQACAISVLARMAARNNEKARRLVDKIFCNTKEILQSEEKSPHLRRLPLHLARAYAAIENLLSRSEKDEWKELAVKLGEKLLKEHKDFLPGQDELHNSTVGVGINHFALAAESLYWTGMIFSIPEWMEIASGFSGRLIRFCHPDGYFEEHTNAQREGGPSPDYTTLSLGGVYHVVRLAGVLPAYRKTIEKCAAFLRGYSDAQLKHLIFADERTNREFSRPFGLAAHSLSSRGRGYVRLRLQRILDENFISISPDKLARLDYELDGMIEGEGEIPEPYLEGENILSLPMGIKRQQQWTCGLCALRNLNGEIYKAGSYALDRQVLACLAHNSAGTILPGLKSKNDPEWSTISRNDDAYPVRSGKISCGENFIFAYVKFRNFSADLRWDILSPDEASLTFMIHDDAPTLSQLPLEIHLGQSIAVNGDQNLMLTPEPVTIDNVNSISTEHWSAELSCPGKLKWPRRVFDPYNSGNLPPLSEARPILCALWRKKLFIRFTLNRQCGGA